MVAPAYAHISLEQGGTHLSRYGASEIKAGPCGRTGGTRGTHIYTYEPGATIKVALVETIAHPSYFRIAFDNDGDDGFIEPASIAPVDANRKCPTAATDHCGAADYNNSPTVLMDNLDPHCPNPVGSQKCAVYKDGTPTYTWNVTLPNVECTNCTLQVIQVMEDDALHGPYDPTPGVGVEDVYHQCIDIVLKKGAGGDGGAPVADGGSTPVDSGNGGGTTVDSGNGGGTTVDSGNGGGTTVDSGNGGGGTTTKDSGTGGGTTTMDSGTGTGGGTTVDGGTGGPGAGSTSDAGSVNPVDPGSSESGGCSLGGPASARASVGALLLMMVAAFSTRRRRNR